MKVKMNPSTEVEISYIRINAYISYWEDAFVNGVEDDYENPSMPCVNPEKYYWQPFINIETGLIENWQKGVTASTNYKVSDEFECEFLDKEKKIVKSYGGYVPEFMYPNKKGFGDYIILNIDEDGYIQNWDKDLVAKFLENCK